MRKLNTVWTSTLCLWLLTSCGGAPDPAPALPQEPGLAGYSSSLGLTLDDGKKWPVDAHTRASVAEMTRLIRTSAPIDSVEEARTLSARFEGELQNLIQGCTMTGAAHDQLHLVLAALFPRVRELQEGTDLEGLQEAQAKIRSIFEDYERHFR